MHKLGRHYRQPVVLIFSPPILDCNVLALNEACLLKAPPECDHERREPSMRSAVKYSNQRGRLRAHRERPCRRRAPEQTNELAPRAHSITSSARASSVGGTSRPSTLAVLRLMTSSNLVGFCTGRSAGFSPRRIRST